VEDSDPVEAESKRLTAQRRRGLDQWRRSHTQ